MLNSKIVQTMKLTSAAVAVADADKDREAWGHELQQILTAVTEAGERGGIAGSPRTEDLSLLSDNDLALFTAARIDFAVMMKLSEISKLLRALISLNTDLPDDDEGLAGVMAMPVA